MDNVLLSAVDVAGDEVGIRRRAPVEGWEPLVHGMLLAGSVQRGSALHGRAHLWTEKVRVRGTHARLSHVPRG